jgi:CubicO group peptidase (beta-lactamase class C family)
MRLPGINRRRLACGLVAAILPLLQGGASSDPRIARVLDNLKVIDFSTQTQTGESAPLAARMVFYKTPGVSVAVIRDNAVAWTRGAGVLKAGEPARVTPQSIFQAGSASKFVTAILILHFVEEGKLDLDSDVNRFLTSWKVPECEFTRNRKVTLRYLLSHQAGIPNVATIKQDAGQAEATLPQILSGAPPALTSPAVPEREPGTQWAYSNLGYTIIQLVLEDITGKPLPQIAEEVLFRPLGMSSSSFSYPLKNELRQFEAWPHDSQGQPRPPESDGLARAMGGLLTTPGDMATLTIEVMKAHQGQSKRIISPASARLLVSRQIKVPTEAMGLPLSNGLGVFIDDSTDELCFLHPGHNSPGTTFLVIAYPALGEGAVIAVNGNVGDRLYLELVASLSNEYNWPSGQPFRR